MILLTEETAMTPSMEEQETTGFTEETETIHISSAKATETTRLRIGAEAVS